MPIRIEREEARRLIADGARLVEVLPGKDFEREHLPGAVNIPLKDLDRDAVAGFDRDVAVVVYCWDLR